MKANQLSFSKSEAVSYLSRNRRNGVIYLRKFDVDVVFRKGKLEDEKISSVRYKEDDRPQTSFNKRTNRDETKKNDIVTYKMDGKNELYVLAKSGGVSLFDGMSTKVKLGKKDCWWVITQNAKIPRDLIVAKDVFKDSEGNTHYSIEPDRDMPLAEYIDKLNELKQYMRRY